MILELCVTELEDVASDTETGRNAAQPVVQESPHPYTDDTSLNMQVKIQGQSTHPLVELSYKAYLFIDNESHVQTYHLTWVLLL